MLARRPDAAPPAPAAATAAPPAQRPRDALPTAAPARGPLPPAGERPHGRGADAPRLPRRHHHPERRRLRPRPPGALLRALGHADCCQPPPRRPLAEGGSRPTRGLFARGCCGADARPRSLSPTAFPPAATSVPLPRAVGAHAQRRHVAPRDAHRPPGRLQEQDRRHRHLLRPPVRAPTPEPPPISYNLPRPPPAAPAPPAFRPPPLRQRAPPWKASRPNQPLTSPPLLVSPLPVASFSPAANFSNPFLDVLLSYLPSAQQVASTINIASGVLDVRGCDAEPSHIISSRPTLTRARQAPPHRRLSSAQHAASSAKRCPLTGAPCRRRPPQVPVPVQARPGFGVNLMAEIFNETGTALYYSYSVRVFGGAAVMGSRACQSAAQARRRVCCARSGAAGER